MPKVIIGIENRQKQEFKKWLLGEIHERKVKQEILGYELGITQQAFCYRLSKCKFDYTDMIKLFRFFDASDETILRLMRGGAG